MMAMPKLLEEFISVLVGTPHYELCSESLISLAYPLDLEFTLQEETRYYSPKSAEGIPLLGHRRFPTRIAAYGLAHFNRYLLQGRGESREIFLRMADWFHQSPDGLWRYEFDMGDMKAPWISCMAQGEGISVLVRAYRLTGKEGYLEQAIKAAQVFSLPIQAGGVRSQIEGEWDFLEEYPSLNPRHTLNGFLYALIGILDLAELEPAIKTQVGWDALLKTIETRHTLWDLSYWSAYDLHVTPSGRKHAATVAYHKLHITQMKYLGLKIGSLPLQKCAEKWLGYYRSPSCRWRALIAKTRYRLSPS